MNKDKKKTAALLVIAIVLLAVFLFMPGAKAVSLDVGLNYAAATGLPSQDIRLLIANIIRVALGLLGIVALSLVIYGGYVWMTAAGNPEKVDKAKKILINSAIGLAIILSAYTIVSFIIGAIMGGYGAGGGGGATPYGGGGGALGNGIIQSHYPARNATGVPRNTSIAITFKEPIEPTTLMSGDQINANNVWIYQTDDKTSGMSTPSGKQSQVTGVRAAISADNKTILYKPNAYLGSPDQNIRYTVELRTNIQKQGDGGAFGDLGGYSWEFEVSTVIDVTPPKVVSVIPLANQTYPRNVVVQINFNEPINPMTIGGKTDSFDMITVSTADIPKVAGEFFYSNQYKTTEFVTNDLCGQNSCGGNVYCLPGPAGLTVAAKAADLVPVDPQRPADPRFASLPYTGIVDMADNSLDGNGSGASEGPPPDNYEWKFSTSSEIRLEPPQINVYSPIANSSGVNPSDSNGFTIDFSSLVMSSTIKPDSNYGDGLDYIGLIFPESAVLIAKGYPAGGWAYWLESENFAVPPDTIPSQTRAFVYHATLGEDLDMQIKVGSGVKDIYQNCYMPCAGPNCVRSQIGPGQYQAGSPWTGAFPSCDLTQ